MHVFDDLIRTYLSEPRNQRAQPGTSGELPYRDFLGKLLRGAAQTLGFAGATFNGEKTLNTYGRPDYVVTDGLKQIGCIEAEAITANLSDLKGGAKAQNERFRRDIHNFLLTNHLDFRLYVDGKETLTARLPAPPEHGKIAVAADDAERFGDLLSRVRRR
jgi:hypothetical protein